MSWTDAQKIEVVVKTMMRLVGRKAGVYKGLIQAPMELRDQQMLDHLKLKHFDLWRAYYEDAAAILTALEGEPL